MVYVNLAHLMLQVIDRFLILLFLKFFHCVDPAKGKIRGTRYTLDQYGQRFKVDTVPVDFKWGVSYIPQNVHICCTPFVLIRDLQT